jgi:hypothetical protein
MAQSQSKSVIASPFRSWIEAKLIRNNHMPSDPRMKTVPMFPRNTLYNNMAKEVRDSSTMFTYSQSVVEFSRGAFKLFGIECKAVPGYDNDPYSVEKSKEREKEGETQLLGGDDSLYDD